jgi:hypothetical protein
VTKKKAGQQAVGANNPSPNPQTKKKVSIRQRWNQTALHNKYLVVKGMLALISGAVYTVTVLVQTILSERHRKEDHRAIIINSRPPEFLQPFVCDVKAGFHTGNMQILIKNVGNATADIFPTMFEMKVVPERKRGTHSIDDPPAADCSGKIREETMMFPLVPGREVRPQIRQSAMSLPAISDKEPVQLYAVNCVYYRDAGVNHATCDTYRLQLTSTNPIDALNGTPSFLCDKIPRIGRFIETLTGHCAK